jgi:hypothetical protein
MTMTAMTITEIFLMPLFNLPFNIDEELKSKLSITFLKKQRTFKVGNLNQFIK